MHIIRSYITRLKSSLKILINKKNTDPSFFTIACNTWTWVPILCSRIKLIRLAVLLQSGYESMMSALWFTVSNQFTSKMLKANIFPDLWYVLTEFQHDIVSCKSNLCCWDHVDWRIFALNWSQQWVDSSLNNIFSLRMSCNLNIFDSPLQGKLHQLNLQQFTSRRSTLGHYM